MVNGIQPEPIEVKKGTRQGDPMSCLIYDLAIEPLACTLRKTERLKGYKINNEKIITRLYADVTSVYLRKQDRIKDMENIIEVFCDASTAKYNLEKTEVLSIGTREHRERVLRNRDMGKGNIIPGHVKLMKDRANVNTRSMNRK